MIVTYEDGTTDGVELGVSYGKAEGSIYPLPIVANISKGKKFKKDDVLAYNNNYFERDHLDPAAVVLKTSFSVKTALYESNQTFEDSSSISTRIAKKLSTKVVKDKHIVVKFEQNVVDLVKLDQTVDINDSYLSIEDEITTVGNFSESSLSALKDLSSQTPKFKYHGIVSDITVYYNGDKADMTEGLRKIANASDKRLAAKLKSSGKATQTGKVDSDYRVAGKNLLPNTAVIVIYTTVEVKAGVGDKGVFGNQLKSVFGEIMEYDMTTESGEKIDATFGYRSIAARIVSSPILIGTTTTILKLLAKKANDVYRS